MRKTNKLRDPEFLAFVRTLPCANTSGLCFGPIQAAHVRMYSDAGIAEKPSDCYAVPLCAVCHRRQHDIGEPRFWGDRNPHDLCDAIWQFRHDLTVCIVKVNRFANTGRL